MREIDALAVFVAFPVSVISKASVVHIVFPVHVDTIGSHFQMSTLRAGVFDVNDIVFDHYF